MVNRLAVFEPRMIETISEALAATDYPGLTGRELALLLHCDQELISRCLFHAISEAAKSIPERIRRHTGLGTDRALTGPSSTTRCSVPTPNRQ